MAAKARLINNKWCRYYRDGYIWVPEDGSAATALIDNHYKKLKLVKDGDGLWAKHPWGHYISMAEAVITCFCPPKPDAQKYSINYKDGNIYNCTKQNLEWIPYHYQHNLSDSVKFYCYDSEVEVFRDGMFRVDGVNATVYDYLYDPDIDRHICIRPHILVNGRHYYQEREPLEDLMNKAGFVQGDDAGMICPKILHIDNNWMNFASDNLLFVEADDPRYIEFSRIEREEKNRRIYELNPGLDIHDFMLYKI